MLWAFLTMFLWALAIAAAVLVAVTFATYNGLWLIGLILFIGGCVSAVKAAKEL